MSGARLPPERLEARSAEIGGGLTIRRALPNRHRRTVGAWCFLDHAGPMEYAADGGMHVGPHPHIGLQTFTWMIEGEVVHRDSLGNEQLVTPGQVNLMTAGAGIAHAEDSAPGRAGTLHAAQLWIALPEGERRRPPAFRNYPQLPLVRSGGFDARVLAGSAFGQVSPAEVYSPLIGLDLTAKSAASLSLALTASFEHAALVLSGTASVAGETLSPGALLYFAPGREELGLRTEGAARILVIGGTPFDEQILVWWNFVARTRDEIAAATRDWNAGRFGAVRGSPAPPLVAPDVAGLNLRPAPPAVT
jgi:hypothetical protein